MVVQRVVANLVISNCFIIASAPETSSKQIDGAIQIAKLFGLIFVSGLLEMFPQRRSSLRRIGSVSGASLDSCREIRFTVAGMDTA
jgi:hypothetical protein